MQVSLSQISKHSSIYCKKKIGGRELSKVFTPSRKSEKRERETKELQKFTVILTNML